VPKIPGHQPGDAVRLFEKLGYRIARKAGHIVMTNGNNGSSFHATIQSCHHHGLIAKSAGLTPDEFRRLL